MIKCPNCKINFKTKSKKAIYCSTSCRNSAYQKRLRLISLFHSVSDIKEKDYDLSSLRGALLAINPAKNNLWKKVGQALANGVFMKEITEKDAFHFWMNWSKLRPNFNVEEAKEKWLSFPLPKKIIIANVKL